MCLEIAASEASSLAVAQAPAGAGRHRRVEFRRTMGARPPRILLVQPRPWGLAARLRLLQAEPTPPVLYPLTRLVQPIRRRMVALLLRAAQWVPVVPYLRVELRRLAPLLRAAPSLKARRLAVMLERVAVQSVASGKRAAHPLLVVARATQRRAERQREA